MAVGAERHAAPALAANDEKINGEIETSPSSGVPAPVSPLPSEPGKRTTALSARIGWR